MHSGCQSSFRPCKTFVNEISFSLKHAFYIWTCLFAKCAAFLYDSIARTYCRFHWGCKKIKNDSFVVKHGQPQLLQFLSKKGSSWRRFVWKTALCEFQMAEKCAIFLWTHKKDWMKQVSVVWKECSSINISNFCLQIGTPFASKDCQQTVHSLCQSRKAILLTWK